MKIRTMNEAAAKLGCTRAHLVRGIKSGKYSAMRWGTRTLVDVDALRPIIEDERRRAAMIGVRECAARTGLSLDQVRRGARSGMIPCERFGREYKFRVEDITALMRGGSGEDGKTE